MKLNFSLFSTVSMLMLSIVGSVAAQAQDPQLRRAPTVESHQAQGIRPVSHAQPCAGCTDGYYGGNADQMGTPLSVPMNSPSDAAMTPPSAGNQFPTTQDSSLLSSSYGASQGGYASVPNMIGDTSAGGCGGLRLGGALVASLAHPTYACSRLNIAENNSPVVRDRVYFSYRHFENASELDFFSYSPQGRAGNFNIDTYTFGIEKKLNACWSVEMRLPINTQLGSDLSFIQTDSGTTTDGSNNNLDDVLANGRETDIGNISFILKRELHSSQNWYWSGGMGINTPTAPDIRLRGRINDPNYQVYQPPPAPPGTLVNGPIGSTGTGDELQLAFDGTYTNETFNLQPFLAGVWTPNQRTWFQGFLQVDVPVNDAFAELSYEATEPTVSSLDESGFVGQQTLLRLNAGAGRWFYQNQCECNMLRAIGGIVELHYTTTLNDPDAVSIQVPTDFGLPGVPPSLDLDIAGLGGRVDILNFVAGVPVVLGRTTIYNGFTVPLRDGFDRGFDFEYSLVVDRQF